MNLEIVWPLYAITGDPQQASWMNDGWLTAAFAVVLIVGLFVVGWLSFVVDAELSRAKEREAQRDYDRELANWHSDIEVFDYRPSENPTGDEALDAAIREWRAALVDMTPEQKERSWQTIAAQIPQYPRGRVTTRREVGEPS